MSASTLTAPVRPAAEPARRPAHARELGLAGLYFLVAAVLVTMWLWRDPASRIVAANPYDSDQAAWFLRYDATAVAHLRLPALVTAGMNAPRGVNLMWNTPLFLPGTALAPLTLLAGAQASLTLLLTLGFAGSALSLYAVLRRRNASRLAAALAGLVYGFSPALLQSAQGHYDLQFAVLPPLIVDAFCRLAAGHYGPGRRPALLLGGGLGLAVAAQVFITEESAFDAVLTALILLAVLAASGQRPRAGRARDTLAGAAAAAATGLAVAGYPLWVQFLGPDRQYGSPFTPDYYKNDLAGFVRPPGSMLLRTPGSTAFTEAFRGQPPEYLAYLGLPLLLVLAGAAAWLWRRPAPRALAVTFAVLETLSLGGTLLAAGHEYPGARLPWYWLQSLPVIGSAIPDRFSIVADGAAAALLALALDAARARWPARTRPAARWAVAGITVAALAPLVPRPLPAGTPPGVPPGWTAAFAALRLPAGAAALVVPVPGASFTEPLRWQADTGVPSSLTAGYFLGPGRNGHAETDGPGTPPGGRYLNLLWTENGGGAPAARAARAAARQAGSLAGAENEVKALLRSDRPAAVVAVTRPGSPLGQFLSALLGPPAARDGSVLGWRVSRLPLPAWTIVRNGMWQWSAAGPRDWRRRGPPPRPAPGPWSWSGRSTPGTRPAAAA